MQSQELKLKKKKIIINKYIYIHKKNKIKIIIKELEATV